jgi:hypothetical protein
MSAAAKCSESGLNAVPMAVTTGRRLRIAGVLKAHAPLEEVSFVTPHGPDRPARTMRAFRVHGSVLEREGVRDGDHLIIESTPMPPVGATILAVVDGQFILRRIAGRASDGSLTLAPTANDLLPLAERTLECRILGAFVGLMRKRGFARAVRGKEHIRSIGSDPTANPISIGKRPASKSTVLRNQLRMLERIRLDTKNPRLQRALRTEADRVRLLLQNGAA